MFIIWFRGEYFSYIFYSSTHVFISGVYIWPNLCSAFSAMFSQFSKPLPMMLLVDFRFSLIQRCLKLPWSFQSIPSTGCLHVPLQLNNDPPPSHPFENSLLFNCLLALLSFGASAFGLRPQRFALRACGALWIQRGEYLFHLVFCFPNHVHSNPIFPILQMVL